LSIVTKEESPVTRDVIIAKAVDVCRSIQPSENAVGEISRMCRDLCLSRAEAVEVIFSVAGDWPGFDAADAAKAADHYCGPGLDDSIKRAQKHEADQADKNKPRLVLRTHSDRLRDRASPPPALVAGLLPVGGIGLIIAQPGTGKTVVAVDLARAVAAGGMFAGRRCQPGRVIYACPDSPASTERRMLAIDPETAERISTVTDFRLDEAGSIALAEAVKAERMAGRRVALLGIDTWDAAREHGGGSWSSEDAAIEGSMRVLRRLAEDEGLTIVIVHHATRQDGGRARGSSVLDARVEMIAIVEAQEGGRLCLRTTKNRDGECGTVGHGEIVPFALLAGGAVATLRWLTAPQTTAPLEPRSLDLLRYLARPGRHTARSLQDALSCGSSALDRLVKPLREAGLVDGYRLTQAGQHAAFGDDGTPQKSTGTEASCSGSVPGGFFEPEQQQNNAEHARNRAEQGGTAQPCSGCSVHIGNEHQNNGNESAGGVNETLHIQTDPSITPNDELSLAAQAMADDEYSQAY
jgi:hypothetical protein